METHQQTAMTVDRTGLAAILHRSPLTIRRQMSEAPDSLPPPVRGTKPRIWRVERIEEWLRERDGGIPGIPPSAVEPAPGVPVVSGVKAHSKRGRGRPRKLSGATGAEIGLGIGQRKATQNA